MKSTTQLERDLDQPLRPVPHEEPPSAPSQARFGLFVPNATAFIASACIMVIEILSGRLVSPFLGSSLYTWTSAIGVVLAGISIGNYIGGRLSDRYHLRRTLSVLFLLASVFCMAVPAVNAWIGQSTALQGFTWPQRIFLHFVVAFLPPATLLGMIGPVVAKMALNMGRATGRTIGTIYAWGAVGSIGGTFMAGFLLIAWMGTAATVFTVAGILALMGLFYGYRSWVPYAWGAVYAAAILCAVLPWSAPRAVAEGLKLRMKHEEGVIYSEESQYQLVRVIKALGDPNERVMLLDKLVHSKVNVLDPLDLKYEYEWVYAAVMRQCHPENQPLAALVIGGGGFSYPRYLEAKYPGSYIEVAEIDPEVTEAAYEVFGMPRNTTIKSYNMDARNHVSDLVRRKKAGAAVRPFDFIFGDSISDFSVPYHLTTREFNEHLDALMTDRGIYMLNLIDMLEPGRFVGAVVNTCRQVFPHTYVFKTSPLDNERDTFIVVNSKQPLALGGVVDAIRAAHPFRGRMLTDADMAALAERSGRLVLTDDYAPVENLLTSVVKIYQSDGPDAEGEFFEGVLRLIDAGNWDEVERLCRKKLDENPKNARAHMYLGVVLAKRGQFAEAIPSYREAVRLDPDNPKAHANLGMALANQGDLEAALAAYREAIRLDYADVGARNHLALALARLERTEEAVAEFRKAIAQRPGFADAHYNLGALLQRKRAFEAAAAEFAEVLRLRPDYPNARRALAGVLLDAGKSADAVPHLRAAIAAEPDRAELHDQLGQALAQAEDLKAAETAFSRAVELAPENADFRTNLVIILNNLAWSLATSPDDAQRDCNQAVKFAERLSKLTQGEEPGVLDTTATALACAGRYEEAITIGRRAAELARTRGDTELAGQIESRITLYEAGRPYREAP